MNTKKFLTFSTGTLLITAILIVINIMVAPIPMRLDLTSNKVFSLSEPTKELLSSLSDTVQIKAYMTNDLPPETSDVKQYIESMLREYKAFGGSKLQIEFIDPTSPEKEREAQEAGLFPLQFNKIENDSFVSKKGYLGISFRYGEKKEVLPQLTKTEGLEYEFTSTLRKITTEKLANIAVLQGYGAPTVAYSQEEAASMEALISMLKKTYTVSPWDPTTTPSFPENTQSIIIAGITEDLSPETISTLQGALDKGVHLLIAQNHTKVDTTKNIEVQQLTLPNFKKFLEDNELFIADGLIADTSNQRITVSSQQGMFLMQQMVQFPLFVLIKNPVDTPISKDITPLTIPFVTEVGFSTTKETDMVFARSSNTSNLYTQTSLPMTNPEAFFSDQQRVHTLGIARPEDGTKGRKVLLGSSQCLIDQIRDQSCISLFLNAVDWTMQDARLIAVRNKGMQTHLLRETSAEEKRNFRIALLAIPSLIVIGGGLIYAFRRSRKASQPYHF